MQAWQYTSIKDTLEGSLVLNETATPPDAASLDETHVLIDVIAAGINPVDYKLLEVPMAGKFMFMPSTPASPGFDFCGRIRAVHPSNTTFSKGQLVFGALSVTTKLPKFGSLGQILVAPASQIASLPPGVAPEDAAAIGTAGLTALQSLPRQQVIPGSRVFINGGSGGVGSFALQFAKAMGAHVTTTCSTANVQLCRNLGADEVIDYREADVLAVLTGKGQVFDVAVDNVGALAGLYERSGGFLKPEGTFVQVGLPGFGATLRRGLLPGRLFGPRRAYKSVAVAINREDLDQVGRWMVEGKVRAVLDEKFAWEDAPKAYEKLRKGRTTGKIVVQVGRE
ncbi:hypothetical protein B0T11DRAFT_11163 [Plectosphaerella cucumerina]|jgi:NADPH:quinone reductase-like Zn-dependent oxidoreductase|uniref:Enoyl reductase (ER) domain-containing protein n=1 Tax=Plectosphaerella cucumerina TaxID=40658 RepID=A0A8K0TQR8_9PEZI|nr:hypothetical protein B0T11DRAFT_11163 [Plectosphaerella cucumerina]